MSTCLLEAPTTDDDNAVRAPVAPADVLAIPRHKRLFVSLVDDPAGTRELHLTFGELDLVFDDPAWFPFGEGLARHARFAAHDVLAWCPAAGWDGVAEKLHQLLDVGLIVRAADCPPDPAPQGLVESPLPPAPCTQPRTWREAPAIVRALTGRALDPAHLELVVPVYRVAHPMLDTEGRQVGEANVFPAPLRLEVPTEWRVCQHAGSRFQDAQPMNVSALRSMIKHWKPAMALLLQLREAFLRRYPAARTGMTVGDLQRLTSLVLAVPAWLAVRRDHPLDNGTLDPVLSSLFRVTDGVRMVMHRMLFTADNERSRTPGETITAAEVYAYSERNTAFLSDHGVCAGPKRMIEEFLEVLVHGRGVEGGDAVVFGPQVRDALANVDAAFDYGLRGLQAYAAAFSLWPPMARAYERLAHIVETHRAPAALADWSAAVRAAHEFLADASRVRDEARRRVLEDAYADLFARCAEGLGEKAFTPLPDQLAAQAPVTHRYARHALRQALDARCGDESRRDDTHAFVAATADALADYLAQEHAIVRAAAEAQARVNAVIDRAAPTHPLAAADLALHYKLVAFHYSHDELQGAGGQLPYLVDDVARSLGIDITVTADAIAIESRLAASTPAPMR